MVAACVAECLKGKIQEAPWKREALMFKERKERIFSTGGVGEERGCIPGLGGTLVCWKFREWRKAHPGSMMQ